MFALSVFHFDNLYMLVSLFSFPPNFFVDPTLTLCFFLSQSINSHNVTESILFFYLSFMLCLSLLSSLFLSLFSHFFLQNFYEKEILPKLFKSLHLLTSCFNIALQSIHECFYIMFVLTDVCYIFYK